MKLSLSQHRTGVAKISILGLILGLLTAATTVTSASPASAAAQICPTPVFAFTMGDPTRPATVGSSLILNILNSNYLPTPANVNVAVGVNGIGAFRSYRIDRYDATGSALLQTLRAETSTSNDGSVIPAPYVLTSADLNSRIKLTVTVHGYCDNGTSTPDVTQSAISNVVQLADSSASSSLLGIESSQILTPAFSPYIHSYSASVPLSASSPIVQLRPVLVNDSQTITVDDATTPLDTSKNIEYSAPTNLTGSPTGWQKVFHVTSADGLHGEAYTINFTVNPKLAPVVPANPANIQIFRGLLETQLQWSSYTSLNQGSSPIAGYQIYIYQYDPSGNYMPGAIATPQIYSANLVSGDETTTSVAIRSLLEGYSYCFGVQAYNNEGLSAVSGSVHPATFPVNDRNCTGPLPRVTNNVELFNRGLRIDDSGVTFEGTQPVQNFLPYSPDRSRYESTLADEGSLIVFQPTVSTAEIQTAITSPVRPSLKTKDSLTSIQNPRFSLPSGVTNFLLSASKKNYDVTFNSTDLRYQYITSVGHTFGSTPRDKSAPIATFNFQNTESQTVNVTLSIAGAGFTLASQSCGSLTPMLGAGAGTENCLATVGFSPTSSTPDTSTGSLTVTYRSLGGDVLHIYTLPLLGYANSTNTRTLTWNTSTTLHVSDNRYPANAVASMAESALPSYSVANDNGTGCSTNGTTITLLSTGDCTITATLPAQTIGGVAYPSVSTSRIFHVIKSLTSANLGLAKSLGGNFSQRSYVGESLSGNPLLPTGIAAENFSVAPYFQVSDSSDFSVAAARCRVDRVLDSSGKAVLPFGRISALAPGRCYYRFIIPASAVRNGFTSAPNSIDFLARNAADNLDIQQEYSSSVGATVLKTTPDINGVVHTAIAGSSSAAADLYSILPNGNTSCEIDGALPILYNFSHDSPVTEDPCQIQANFPATATQAPYSIVRDTTSYHLSYRPAMPKVIAIRGINADGTASASTIALDFDLSHTNIGDPFIGMSLGVFDGSNSYSQYDPSNIICNPIDADQHAHCEINNLTQGVNYRIYAHSVAQNAYSRDLLISDYLTPKIIQSSAITTDNLYIGVDGTSVIYVQIPPLTDGAGADLYLGSTPTGFIYDTDTLTTQNLTCGSISNSDVALGYVICNVSGLFHDHYNLSVSVTAGGFTTSATSDSMHEVQQLVNSDALAYQSAVTNSGPESTGARDSFNLNDSIQAEYVGTNNLVLAWTRIADHLGWNFDHYRVQIDCNGDAPVIDTDTYNNIFIARNLTGKCDTYHARLTAEPIATDLVGQSEVSIYKTFTQSLTAQSIYIHSLTDNFDMGNFDILTASSDPAGASTVSGLGLQSFQVASGKCFTQGNIIYSLVTGICTATASVKADDGYSGAKSDQLGITVNRISRTLEWDPVTSLTTTQSGIVLPLPHASTSAAGDLYSFQVSNETNTANCSINQLSLALTFTQPGQCAIRAKISGAPDYLDAYSGGGGSDLTAPYTVIFISKNARPVYWNPRTSLSGSDFGTSVASLGLPSVTIGSVTEIAYQMINSGSAQCTLLAGYIRFYAPGTCSLAASFAGDSAFPVSNSDPITFTVNSAPRVISWAPGISTLTQSNYSQTIPGATASGPGDILYSVAPLSQGNCTITSKDVVANTIGILATGTGSCALIATAASSAGYISSSFTITLSINASTDNSLSALLLYDSVGNQIPITPGDTTTVGFVSENLSYTVPADGNPAHTTYKIQPFANNSFETITILGAVIHSGDTYTATLSSGTTVIPIRVSSALGVQREYKLFLHKTMNLGATPVGLPFVKTISISNSIGESVTITGITTLSDSAEFSIAAGTTSKCIADGTTSITAYGSCNLVVTYLPTQITDPLNPPLLRVRLTGTAASGRLMYETATLYGIATGNIQVVTYNGPLSYTTSATTISSATVTPGGGTISYTVLGTSTSSCSIQRYLPTVQFTSAGICDIQITAAATPVFNAASIIIHINVALSQQSLSVIGDSYSVPVLDQVTLTGIGKSGSSQYLYSLDSNSSTLGCALVGNVLTSSAVGTCYVYVSVSADSLFDAASSASVAFSFTAVAQVITWNPTNLTGPFTLHRLIPNSPAFSDVGSAITYSVDPLAANSSLCNVDRVSGVIFFKSAGACTVIATGAANSTYLSSAISRTFTITPGVPSIPTFTSFSTGETSVTLGFSAPSEDGGSPITSYSVVLRDQTGNETLTAQSCTVGVDCVAASGGKSFALRISGLTPGHRYVALIAAINGNGSGEYSAPSPSFQPHVQLSGVEGLSLFPADGALRITFSAPTCLLATPSTCGTFAGYNIQTSTDGVFWNGQAGYYTDLQYLHGGEFIADGLTNGISYFVQVTAYTVVDSVNDSGTAVTLSQSSTAQATQVPAAVPSAPTNVSATKASLTSANVTWRAPDRDGGIQIDSYTVTATRVSNSATLTVDCLSSPCLVTGLNQYDTYTFSVLAHNFVGNGAPSAESAPLRMLFLTRNLNFDASVPSTLVYGSGAVLLATPTAGGGTISYSAVGGGCIVTGSTVLATAITGGAINCLVRVDLTPDLFYEGVGNSIDITVTAAPRSVTWYASNAAPTFSADAGAQALIAPVASDSEATFNYYIVSGGNTAGCSFNGSNQLVVTSSGSCQLYAVAPQDSHYETATSNTVNVTVTKDASRSIIWSTTPTDFTWGAAKYDNSMALAAVSSGTATVRYTVSDSGLAGCSLRIDGGGVAHLRYLNVGTCEILAYVDATPVLASAAATHTFTIIDVAQVMSWSPSTTSFAESDSPYTIPAARSSGMGALVYTVSPESSAVCALSGSNQISMNNVGNCTISASATEVRDSLDSSKILYAASTIPATYSFVVTASTVNTLSNISLGSIPFIEGAFSSTLEDYHADLKAGQSATLTLTLAERHESITALTLIDDHLDTTVLAYTPGMTLPLSTGSNSLSIQVASHSGSVKTYIIVLHLYPAQQITWTPIASVMESRAAVNIGKATALGGVDFHYSVKGSSTATCDISNASSPVATFTGAGDCIVQVTAEISNQYNLATTEQTITVLPSNDATLSSISLSDGFVSSTLSDTEINYISMPNGRATFNLDGFTVNGIGATVQFNNVGLPILSKTGITLDPNDQATQFLLTVTAHDGTRKVYTFRGTRALHINWNLTTAIYERVLGGMTLADFFGSLPQVSSSAATLTTSVIDGDGTVCSYAGGTFTTLFPGTCVLQVTASSVAGLTDADPLIETITIIPSSVTGLSVLTPRGALAGVGASPDIYTYANVDVIPGEGVGLRYSAKSGLEEVTVQINGVNYNCAENCMFEDELTDGVNIVTITTRSDFEVVHDLSSYSPQYSFTITKWKLQEFTTTWLHSVVQGFSTSLFPINGVYIEANRRYSIPSGDARVCTLNNAQLGSIFFGGVGTCHITVNSASSGFYRAAEPVTYEISVTADPTIGLRGSVTSNGVSIDVLPEIDTYNVTPSGPNDTVTVALRNIGYATTPPTYTLNGVTLPLPDNSTFALIPGQLNLLAVQAFNDAGEFIFYEFNFLLPSIPVDPVPSPTPSPIPDFLKAPHDSPAETSTAVVAEPAAPVVTPIVIAPEPKPIDKVAQPQVVAHFSSAAMWVKQRVSLIINPEQSSVALVIASATPGICALTTAGLIYASHAGRCVISVVNPTDATHVASTTTFTIKVIAPSLKVKSLLKPLRGKQIAITAGPIYKKKTIRIFSLPVGAKRSILLGTIKLNGQGVGLLVTPTLKSSKISLVYSHRTIASIKVK